MREILFIIAAIWGVSFVVAITWFGIDERKYRRTTRPVVDHVDASHPVPAATHAVTATRQPAVA